MACQRPKAHLRDAALETLDPAKAIELKAHLEVCAECRTELERERLLLAAIDRQLSTVLEASPSPEFSARVRTRLAAESARPKAALTGWVLAAAGALAACALLVGWFAPKPSMQRRAPLEVRHSPPPVAPLYERRSWSAAARPGLPGEHAPALHNVHRSEPEVLIDPAERQSLVRFYNSIRAGRVDVSSLISVPAGFELGEDGSLIPKLLEIEPLKIAALQTEPQAGAEETRNTQ